MIKGWRNDPRWVAHYATRDEERLKREMIRMDIEISLMKEEMRERLEAAISPIRKSV